jgi:hypothetical protein
MERRTQPFPDNDTVAVDIDETLIVKGRVSAKAVRWAEKKRAEGKFVILWSARGSRYAREVAEKHGVAGNFDAIIGKPRMILDDNGWKWVRFCRSILPIQLK